MFNNKISAFAVLTLSVWSLMQATRAQSTSPVGSMASVPTDVNSLLVAMSKSEVQQRKLTEQVSTRLEYGIPLATGKEKRVFFITPAQVIAALSVSKKSLRLMRSKSNGVRYLIENVSLQPNGMLTDSVGLPKNVTSRNYGLSSSDGREWRDFGTSTPNAGITMIPTQARGTGSINEAMNNGLGTIFGSLLRQKNQS